MKQFMVTVAGVFVGLLMFFVGLPFVLIIMATGASKPAATPLVSSLVLLSKRAPPPKRQFAPTLRNTKSSTGMRTKANSPLLAAVVVFS